MVRADIESTVEGMYLEYDTFGDPSDPAFLLVMGLSVQMLAWREEFCEKLASHGYYVIRFDNRDIGLSKHFDHLGPPPLIRRVIYNLLFGRFSKIGTPYTLDDMARDSFGLLTHLGIEKAHIAGCSMGGMICQTMALMSPERVLSLASIMSTTGARNLPDGDLDVRLMLLKRPGPTHEDRVARTVDAINMISRPQTPDPTDLSYYADRVVSRCWHPVGGARQMNAILAQDDRTSSLGGLEMPCVVVHGGGDTLVPVEHGRATAKAIGGDVGLVVIERMGHAISKKFYDVVVTTLVKNASRKKGGGGIDISDLDLTLE
ncbi:hypothetical protein TrCOL_g7945 [Triparma columacea]|uniref:AB hydrolase-1 domain-containing protein n=1 Tax=Triparma columacea TaxID=722753 RepID=A0A9W7G8S7_9STRA|nr:hypothetical protein TrCOL_g7945 [Triparma columacea]